MMTSRKILLSCVAPLALIACDGDITETVAESRFDLANVATSLDGSGDSLPVASETQIKILMTGTSLSELQQLNIVSLDLCEASDTCFRLSLDDVEVDEMGAIRLKASSIPSNAEVNYLALNKETPSGDLRIIAETVLSEPLKLEDQRRVAVFLAAPSLNDTEVSDLDVTASAIVAPDSDMIMLLEPGQALKAEMMEGSVAIDFPNDVITEPVILSGFVAGNDVGEINLDFDYLEDIGAIGSVDLRISDETILPGEIANRMRSDYNGRELDMEYRGLTDDARQIYRFNVEGPGLFTLQMRDPQILEANGFAPDPQPQQPPVSPPASDEEGTVSSRFSKSTALSSHKATTSCGQSVEAIMASSKDYYDYVIEDYRRALFQTCYDEDPDVFISIIWMNTAETDFEYISGPRSGTEYQLRTVANHVAANVPSIAVNGYTWSGDRGYLFTDPTGTFDGTQVIDSVELSSDSDAEVQIGFTNPAIYSSSIPIFLDKPANSTFRGAYGYDVVSSFNSVIKDSTCNPNNSTANERRNVMGVADFGPYRFLVNIQTRTGEKTSMTKLCDVLQALEVPNALQLDGGSAAQLVVNGVIRNPLSYTNPKRYVVGSQRPVISALSID